MVFITTIKTLTKTAAPHRQQPDIKGVSVAFASRRVPTPSVIPVILVWLSLSCPTGKPPYIWRDSGLGLPFCHLPALLGLWSPKHSQQGSHSVRDRPLRPWVTVLPAGHPTAEGWSPEGLKQVRTGQGPEARASALRKRGPDECPQEQQEGESSSSKSHPVPGPLLAPQTNQSAYSLSAQGLCLSGRF